MDPSDSAAWRPAWLPEISLPDITPKRFEAMVAACAASVKNDPLPVLPDWVVTGWVEITPERAAFLLQLNRPRANRKVALSTALYYERQMELADWVPTGQPIIIAGNGILLDGQHRLWAVLLSGATITSFMVTGVAFRPNIFAYLDNSRARSPAAGIETAGLNGASASIVAVLKIADAVAAEVFIPGEASVHRHVRRSPIEFIQMMGTFPNARRAVHRASAEYEKVIDYVRFKDVVGYVTMLLLDANLEELADEFFSDLIDPDDGWGPYHPIMGLRKIVDEDRRALKPMKRHQLLAHIIRALNAYARQEDLTRSWAKWKVHDTFPMFQPPEAEDADDDDDDDDDIIDVVPETDTGDEARA